MGCKFSFKRIFLVASLSLAGLFGASSVILKSGLVEIETKDVNAQLDPTGQYRYVLFANCHNSWADKEKKYTTSFPTTAQAYSDKSKAIWYTYWQDGESSDTRDARQKPFASDNTDIEVLSTLFNISKRSSGTYTGKTVVRLKIPVSAQYVKFHDGKNKFVWWGSGNWCQTETLTIPTSGDNLLCVIDSGGTFSGDDNYGYWTLPLLTKTYTGTTKTLFFAPNWCWRDSSHSIGGYSSAYPYIYYQWYDKGVVCQNADWPGVRYTNVSNDIYSFTTPLEQFRQLTILYNNNLTSGTIPRLDFSPTSRNEWWNGTTQTKNLFGTLSDGDYSFSTDTMTTMKSDYYDCPTNEVIFGSFLLDNVSAWNLEFDSAHKLMGTTSSSVWTTDVLKGDSFKYVINALNNTSANGVASSYNLNGNPNNSDKHGYSQTYVKIYDGSESNPVTTNYSSYLSGTDGNDIVFEKSGRVTFKRTNSDANALTLRVIFENTTYIKSDNYLIGSGSFNNDGSSWSTDSGIRMTTRNGYSVIPDQTLEAEDTFKIKNNSTGLYYGWSDFVSGDKTSYFHEAKYNYFVIGATPKWNGNDEKADYTNDSNFTGINEGSGYIGNFKDDIFVKSPEWFYANDCTKVGIHWWTASASGDIEIEVGNHIKTEGTYRIYQFKDVPSDASFIIYRYSTWMDAQTIDLNYVGNGNIVTNNSGVFHIYFDNNSLRIKNISIETTFTAGEALYFDTNGLSEWSGKAPIVQIWHTSHEGEGEIKNITMHQVGGQATLWEAVIPSFPSWSANTVAFYHDDWGDQTNNLGYISGANTFVLSSISDGRSQGAWIHYIKDTKRAEYYGIYFNTEVVCTGEAVDPNHKNWTGVEAEYNSMCSGAQAVAKKTGANDSGTEMQKAVSKYDDIVFRRRYAWANDFMNRNDNDSTSGSKYKGTLNMMSRKNDFNPFVMNGEESFSTIIIIVASSISLLSITVLSVLLVKKRKSKEQ